MYTMGLDIGSTASKGVIVENGKKIVAVATIPSGTGTAGPTKTVKELFSQLSIERKDIEKLVVTGYGRMKYTDADKQISELSCHTKGVHFLVPTVRTIIDIGGQDAKALKLDAQGKLLNFVMNDKCAAGTGRFLDVMAKILEVQVSELGELSAKSTQEISISSTCTVFAESEVISHLSNDIPVEDIISGIHASVAKRVSSLAKRVGIQEDVVMVGGVAQNSGVVSAMEKSIGMSIIIPELAQVTGALGAALYAFEEMKK
ncbi:acyl-CoA dehydratase activase [Marinisporobacter balticus]|uniref:(R)-2-hydroxyisocaproyl-CoA dehydratase activator protein n=1 Tax=Marinisporobacter balticus TaxID=2018667 RepID=A0A4R2KU35_9FIRM|nr:acyl-CoA dehydratase activase [Marinisporobacter balticus]TCO77384.1 (R)-2-hydroxyisocaproyl-CoA dehydratase activator protein [Marinisporobacter balticus]